MNEPPVGPPGFEEYLPGVYAKHICGRFGFTVFVKVSELDYPADVLLDKPQVSVALPHQCDAWEIVQWRDEIDRASGDLQTFAAEMKAAQDEVEHVVRPWLQEVERRRTLT